MKLTDAVLDLLYPPRCVFCHRFLERNDRKIVIENVCSQCRQNLMVYAAGFPLPLNDTPVEICYAPLEYRDTVRESLHRFKFGGNAFYARTYAEIIYKTFHNGELNCDMISWVPLSRARLRKRGYDQAERLARELSRLTGIPCARTLIKRKNIRAQSSMRSAEARLDNIRGAYCPASGCEPAGMCVLLVDDIITTGATLSEAAAVLSARGVRSIKALAVARA